MVSNKILDKHIGKYIRVYMHGDIYDEEDVIETGYLKSYDDGWIEMDYPAFLKKNNFTIASTAIIPREKIKYIDILFKKAYKIHEDDFKQMLKRIEKDEKQNGVKCKTTHSYRDKDRIEIG